MYVGGIHSCVYMHMVHVYGDQKLTLAFFLACSLFFLCSLGVGQVGYKLRELPTSAFWVLELKVHAIMSNFSTQFFETKSFSWNLDLTHFSKLTGQWALGLHLSVHQFSKCTSVSTFCMVSGDSSSGPFAYRTFRHSRQGFSECPGCLRTRCVVLNSEVHLSPPHEFWV